MQSLGRLQRLLLPFTLQSAKVVDMDPITPTELAKAAEISVPYAWQIVNGKRPPSLEMALRIFDATGQKFGALDGLTASEIAAARKMVKAA